MNKVEERVLAVEKEMAEAKGRAQATQMWAGIFGIAILAWLGITSFVQIPNLVDQTAAGEAEAEILRLRQEAASNAQEIRVALANARSSSPIRWITVDDLGAGDDNASETTESRYCFFDRDEADRQLGGWTGWHDRRVLIANTDTGDISIGMIFRQNSDIPERRAHVRFGAPQYDGTSYELFEPPNWPNRQSNWTIGTTCVIGIVWSGSQ